MTQPWMKLTATVLDAPDANELAAFYQRLLGWPAVTDEPGWVTLRPAATEHAIAAGAVLAAYQPQELVRVLLDPAGHPFCLWVAEDGTP